MGAKRLYEMVSFYAKENNKYILVIDNTSWCYLDSAKQQTVMEFYDEVIDEDEIGEIFSNQHTFYEFDTQAVAIDKASEWFPLLKDLNDSDFFIESYVITPVGTIPFTNKVEARS